MLRCNRVLYEKMANKKWTWTAEDNERLKALAATNVSAIRAAAALKRSTTSVRAQARKIGTPFPHMKDYRKQFQDSPESSRQRY
jgi:hypothetical protein